MKKSLYTILIAGAVLISSAVLPSRAFAQSCEGLYGGGEVCVTTTTFSIQKFVQTPGKAGGDYVTNLSINDPKYSPSQTVSFKLVVKNTSSNTISSLTVKDTFPQFISFVSGPGSFDSNSKTLTFTINNLGANQSQEFFVTGKIAEANLLPSDQGIVCVINQASATDPNGDTNSTSSQFCIQKQVLGAAQPVLVTTPATGPEMLPLALLLPGGLGGLLLRKKSQPKADKPY